MPRTPPPLPTIRTIGLMQPMAWLVLAWRDMARAGWISFAHGLALTLFGAAIFAVAHHRFWLLAGALSGFLVVAPVLATSLYALSRAIERGEPADLALVQRTWLNWQRSHRNKWGNDYWCLVQFGVLLALAATGWVLTSASLVTGFAAAQGELDEGDKRLTPGIKGRGFQQGLLTSGGTLHTEEVHVPEAHRGQGRLQVGAQEVWLPRLLTADQPA